MFTVEKLVDTIQNSKKQFVETFVKQENIRDSLNEFIDAQTKYTKTVVDTANTITKTVSDEATKMVKEVADYDWSKFADQATKTIKEATVYDWSKLAESTKTKSKSK